MTLSVAEAAEGMINNIIPGVIIFLVAPFPAYSLLALVNKDASTPLEQPPSKSASTTVPL